MAKHKHEKRRQSILMQRKCGNKIQEQLALI